MTLRLRPLLSGVAVAAALVTVLLMGSVDSARAATTFNPTIAVAVETPTAGVSSNFTSNLDIPSGDVNFAAFIAFIPPEWGVVTGDKIPIGANVGQLDAASVLGLANGACSQQLPVHFDMQNGSLDRNDTVEFVDTDTEEDLPDGSANPNFNVVDYNDFSDPNDIESLKKAVTKYPVWLNRIFTNDATEDPDDVLQPIRRSIGITGVAGVPVILQFLIFAPGTVIDPLIPSDAELGFPSVTVLQNIGDTSAVPAPSIINDFCSPLTTENISNGEDDDGTRLFVNPGDGLYKFNTVALGQRDADGDSFENSLDTCALVANVGDPRVGGSGDLDSDGLDEACDPNGDGTTGTSSDQDLDGYQNRQDNCPLDKNGLEEDNQKDQDLDQIGDTCDPAPTEANGEYSPAAPFGEVAIGAGGDAPGAKVTNEQCDECWMEGDPDPGGSGSQTTPTPAGSSPGATVAPPDDDDGGSSSVIFIVIGVAAAVVVIGGGAALLMRRRSA
jgi:hypothetical protein